MNPYPIANGTTQGAQTRAPRSKVVFELNIPRVVALEFDPPEEAREGNWGPQYMYFCAGNQIAFFEPAVHEQLVQLGAKAGETFAIVKRKSGRQNRWEVNRVEAGRVVRREEPAPAPPLASAPRVRAPESAQAARAVVRAPESAQAARAVVRAPAKETAPPPIREGSERIAGNLMTAALKQAIEAAEESGFAQHAHPEDIRALAITIYITATGGRQK